MYKGKNAELCRTLAEERNTSENLLGHGPILVSVVLTSPFGQVQFITSGLKSYELGTIPLK